jgi:hypothetical protein
MRAQNESATPERVRQWQLQAQLHAVATSSRAPSTAHAYQQARGVEASGLVFAGMSAAFCTKQRLGMPL